MKVTIFVPSFTYEVEGLFTCEQDVWDSLDESEVGETALERATIEGNPVWQEEESENEEEG